jgi:hypothetical protein
MDWEEFKNRLGKIQLPTEENGFIDRFIESQNSIHISVGRLQGKNLDFILDTVSMLEKRGAIREQDYIVTASWTTVGGEIALDYLSIHTTNSFMSPEDFVDIEIGQK